MKKIHIDFETRSEVDIWKRGAYVYCTHPSTEVLCVAYAIDNGPVKIIRKTDLDMYPLVDPFEELCELAVEKDCLFYAHNALFEQLIWEHKLQKKLYLPGLPIPKWRCTMAKALAHTLPKALKDVANALGTSQQKDAGGKALILKLCKPNKDGTWNEDPKDFEKLESYCAQDVETERAVDNVLPELTDHEQLVWFEDQRMNKRGIAVDRIALDDILELLDEETTLLKAQVFEASDGALEGVSSPIAVRKYFKKEGVDLPDFTKATVQKALDEGDIPENLINILRLRQELGLTSTSKYIKLDETVCDDDRLRDILLYHSAGTGRWGGKLVQLHNLPVGTVKDIDTAISLIKEVGLDELRMFYGNVMALFSSCIRGMFIAGPGKDLLVADYASIEARVLVWFSGQKNAIKMFAGGGDPYVEMAKDIYMNPSLTKEDSKERFVGKQAVLGCGFGMGHVRFMAECRSKGIKMKKDFAERVINTYRKNYSHVVKTWYAQERAVRTAISTGKDVECGMVKWYTRGAFLYCMLPSGRSIAYHKAKIGTMPAKVLPDGSKIPAKPNCIMYMGTDSKTSKYGWKSTYGGKIVENIVQAMARDILADAMLRAEKGTYPIVLTVHDELVSEVQENGIQTLEQFLNIITVLPEWAEGCPIDAEGWRGKRYKKA